MTRQPPRDYWLFVADIVASMQAIDEFTAGFDRDKYLADRKTRSAVLRELSVIGEATRSIPAPIREQFAEIPWDEMARTRNRLVHGYFSIDHEIVWRTVKDDLPSARPLLEAMLRKCRPADV
jgi:uncharacterized protein with HEPN domain